MNKSFTPIILLALLVGGYFAFSSISHIKSVNTQKDTSTVSTNNSPDGVDTDSESIQNVDNNNWKLQTTGDYTIKHPDEASIDLREDETIITYMGDKQKASGRTQTELFDGYSVRVSRVLDDLFTDIEGFAAKERENAVENCDYEDGKISSLKSVSIGGAKGFQYSAVNCYIDYTETLLISNDNYYRVSQSYVGDEDDYNGYKQITRDIVATLNFTL